MFQSPKQRRISHIVFSVYLILLIWLVLFKFATNLSEIPSMRSINLIPFYYDQEINTHLKEVLYNVIVFVPLGVYIQIFKEEWQIVAKCLFIFGISFVFELLQYIFAIGASDVTDLIGNTFGGVVGILLCIMLQKITAKKFISIINAVGLIIEIFVITLMMLFLVANYDRKSNDNLPTLATVVEMDEADINTLLIGYKRMQLIEVWGEPDIVQQNEDIWKLNDNVSLRVNSNNKGEIVICGLMGRNCDH